MPNRGPLELSLAERDALLRALPPTADLSDAEDAEERARMRSMNAVLERFSALSPACAPQQANRRQQRRDRSIARLQLCLCQR